MEKYSNSRSKSSKEGLYHHQNQNQPRDMQDLRSYSYSYNSYSTSDFNNKNVKEMLKMKSGNNSKSLKNWGVMMKMDDAEVQRKRRVAGYKAYGVEARMKGSFRKSFRWIKDTCNHVVHGFW